MLSGPVQATGGSPTIAPSSVHRAKWSSSHSWRVGNDMHRADAGASYGFERPAVNSDVVRVAGLTVRRKGQDRVRTHITEDFCDALYCCIGICGGATAIGIAEPMVLGHAEDP